MTEPGPTGRSLPERCLRRPVAATTFVVAAIVIGLISLTRLPLEYLPEIEGRSLTVNVPYPASSPTETAGRVTSAATGRGETVSRTDPSAPAATSTTSMPSPTARRTRSAGASGSA